MDVSCIFVIDLVPSNAGKPLRFKDFRSVLSGAWRTVRALPADGPLFEVVSGGSVCFFGRSVAKGRTVRGVCTDSQRQQAGRSAWPVRTVRPTWTDDPPEPECFVPWFDSSLPSFVLPRVLQGIVPKTRG
jgi:hypothetical protein